MLFLCQSLPAGSVKATTSISFSNKPSTTCTAYRTLSTTPTSLSSSTTFTALTNPTTNRMSQPHHELLHHSLQTSGTPTNQILLMPRSHSLERDPPEDLPRTLSLEPLSHSYLSSPELFPSTETEPATPVTPTTSDHTSSPQKWSWRRTKAANPTNQTVCSEQ